MGKYAVARTYGKGDRPGKVLANLIRPCRSTNLINKMTATDGRMLNNPEDIAARFREYYQTLYTSRGDSDPDTIQEYLAHIVLPKLSESDREALGAPFTLAEIASALGSMAEAVFDTSALGGALVLHGVHLELNLPQDSPFLHRHTPTHTLPSLTVGGAHSEMWERLRGRGLSVMEPTASLT
ncbi:hypothetical protein NDU88_002509 [Pleurodeles waltl]|uniref:Uncharacterized protein n=1 Tax=Pleurodeles waltl TaxID=8319 RepID=A0AAV7SCY3_PLEWA|nr:hypothetical protein NDU88_002509 [Pleurodeles waltl]